MRQSCALEASNTAAVTRPVLCINCHSQLACHKLSLLFTGCYVAHLGKHAML